MSSYIMTGGLWSLLFLNTKIFKNVFDKNRNFGQKWKFWSKMEILVKNGNFGQKWKCWSKMEILVKNRNFRDPNSSP